MMKLATREEGTLIYKAVHYFKEAELYMDMARGYVKSALTENECICNYHVFTGRYEGVIEAVATELKVPKRNVEHMVQNLIRRT